MIQAPAKKEKFIIRLMILFGLLSILNFFYWFVKPDLIEYKVLFWLLMAAMMYDSLRIAYLWYHYWNISIPEKPELKSNFTVDVLTTYFPGEPYDMIKDTLLAIQKIDYPHTTYLCDEANDEYLKKFCQEHNVIHVTRTNRINAKAGNINNALKQATGDLCLVLDPDHVPKETILDELVPFFEDEKIGFVQSVQAYYNVEESLVAQGAAEQTFLFYGPVMMSMNSYGTVNAIGANCLFRRKALDSIGGHAPGLSEDMHTAMQLHAKGWKSVYVPKALTKGLVPETITSYYKQQLKWSRGTLELLVSVYPKLFSKFTWRQRIHYGILPFHYLSGIIYLIAFLIPVISLFTASIPWKGNVVNFGLLFLPIIGSIIGVKIYIQKWLIHKSERGVHTIGGILQACTWWIFSIGFLYTIIRKKVPYLPTPKEDKGSTPFPLLLPNIAIALVSLIAIIYGLSIDLTPFSIFMSGFALVNILYMAFTFVFAYQKPKKVAFSFDEKQWKRHFFLRFRNSGKVLQRSILPFVIIVLLTSIMVEYYNRNLRWEIPPVENIKKHSFDFVGMFNPLGEGGYTNINGVNKLAENSNTNYDIISIYLAWNQSFEKEFPKNYLDSIYSRKSIPMITWEPWMDDETAKYRNNEHIFELIGEGWYDSYLDSMSLNLKELNRPVFLRFAHEFDNPLYPWYVEGDSASTLFKNAWIHVYEIFKKNNAQNVIWIWNPWKYENIAEFYPGEEYVDWIGVDILNYGKLSPDGINSDFRELYSPFHEEFTKLPLTPVIVAEMGTQGNSAYQNSWLDNAFKSMDKDFNEIDAAVFFNSKYDKNWPIGFTKQGQYINWTMDDVALADYQIRQKNLPDYVFSEIPKVKISGSELKHKNAVIKAFPDIKGINFKKGHDWLKDHDVLSRKNLIDDFNDIKKTGVNTIKFEGNSVYNYNVLNISRDFDFNISFGFWIFSEIDFINDSIESDKLEKLIIREIKRYKENKNITSWNIQNDVLYNQKNSFQKPVLLYQNVAYIGWLKNIIRQIKEIDPTRPVFVDLEINRQSVYYSKLLLENIPDIDALGLVAKNDKYLNEVLDFFDVNKINYLYSEINEKLLAKYNVYEANTPFFITAWQDQYEVNKLFFNGITDRKGRYKADYYNLYYALNNSGARVNEPNIRILRPALPIYENASYRFHAMYFDKNKGWLNGYEIQNMTFEWSMVKCDKYGNCLAIKDIGKGPEMTVSIPKKYDYYRLMLTAFYGDTVTTTISTLNTPLFPHSEEPNTE